MKVEEQEALMEQVHQACVELEDELRKVFAAGNECDPAVRPSLIARGVLDGLGVCLTSVRTWRDKAQARARAKLQAVK